MTSNPAYHVPVIGPWLRRVGQVEDLLSIPCATTPMMWVTGFFNSLPKVLWSLYGPDCIDEVFARAGLSHHRRRRIKFRGFTITEALDGGVKLPGFGTWLFEAAEIAQKVGWYMMIVDATTEFAVDWTSAVYQYAGCRPDHGRWIKAINQGGLLIPTSAPNRILVGGTVEGDGHLLGPGGTGVLQVTNMTAGIAYNVNMQVWPLAGPPLPTVRAYILDQFGNKWADSGSITPDGSGRGTIAGFVRKPPPAFAEIEYQLWCEVSGGYADCSGSYLALSDASPAPFFPSPCASITPVHWPSIDD